MPMKRASNILLFILLTFSLKGQIIREFSADTGLYVNELVSFTGTSLQPSEVPDFERFIRLYDSLEYSGRMEIIELSNSMLERKCRPRPHFIRFQQIMIEFHVNQKKSQGYEEWLEGYRQLLRSEQALLQKIDQWLSLTLTLLTDNIFYESNAVTWKVSTPSYQFRTEERMTVRFEDVTVACYSGRDFIQIMNATGYIDPLTLEWVGSAGRVNWERAGMPASEMYADLGDYRINLKTPGYTADSVNLYYPALFDGVALGKLEDKVTLITDLASVKFPQFTSYKNSYRIEDFIEGIDYSGGLSIEGSNLVGTGVGGEPATLEIFRNDTLRVRSETERVSMNSRFIRSPSTAVSIYLEEDSIFHPQLVLTFDAAKNQLRLTKSEHYESQGPYSNSYHRMDMNFDELFWNRDEPVMRLQALQGTSIGRATFESQTFFNYDFYMDLQGMDYVHPLAQLYTYSNSLGGRTFAVPNYAQYIGYSLYQVRHLLMRLTQLGFVYYDDKTDLITLRQKLFDYITAAMRKRDYDVIRFISRTEGASNAELNLRTNDLTIRGIPLIFLSDSQNVRLVPKENSITMKRDRSFLFDGVVDAGLFRFSGHNFFFDYENFKINLQDIDSLQMSIPTGELNQFGGARLARIDNNIEEMTGELLIDDPENKSGLESYPQYPQFTSREASFIYFDRKNIQDGVYTRDEFYFELEPFAVDSLDNFRPEAIQLEGTFISAGILPPLELEMSLREDNSLGFYLESPGEGLPLYGGLGTFYNDIEMSSRGLHGYGTFDFLTSTTWSDDFLMHPDSMMATSRRFLVREQIEGTPFPYAENTETAVKLRPAGEIMEISQIDEAFRIFGDSIFHGGDLALGRSGMSGDGVMALPDARFGSDRFRYAARSFRADSAGVQLKDPSFTEFPFLTSDVRIDVSVDERIGTFTANGDATLIELPYNLYETRLDQMSWMMDRDEVVLTQQKPIPGNMVDIGIDSLRTSGPTYLSVHPGQDELQFVAPEAIYNYRSRNLYASRVPFIEVADAYVFPDRGDVEVGYQASMKLLENAKLLASRINRRHLIYNASIAVNGANDYQGSGYYDYKDAFGNAYPIHFDRIFVDTTIQSRSAGQISEDDRFMLSPYFDFQGEVSLAASEPFLTFDGGVQVVHDCNISKDWLRFTSPVDPGEIRIPVSEQMQNVALNRIFAATMITRDSAHIYSAFLSGRKDYFDAPISSAYGSLTYQPDQERYVITIPEKEADPAQPGKYLELNTATCEVYGEGPLDLTVDYGQVLTTAAGNTLHRLSEDEFSARMVLGLDFHFSPDALRVMGSEIDSLPDLEPVDLTSAHYRLAMKDLLGMELAQKLERQLGLTGAYEEIPPEWSHTLFFNDLSLRWNQETKSFRYNGKVGIGNIGDIQVNKKVDAYIEFVERGSGDIFDMYLEVDEGTWYYFGYSPGGLQALSSNRTFNQIIMDLKASDRRVRSGLGQPQYVYSLAAQRRLDLFIQRFLQFEE